MATYKVPQDVEADDKLIGPFSFRQFVYLIIVALAGAIAWGLGQLFIPLAIIPLPIIILFGALALPLRKDQPMEIFMAAMVSFYLKPHNRLWDPDGIESLIEITVPKSVKVQRTKDLSQNEAQRRFSYLAEIVDSQGWAVRGPGVQAPDSAMNSDVYFEAQQAKDILDFDNDTAQSLNHKLDQSDARRHQDMINMMKGSKAPQVGTAPATAVAFNYFDESPKPNLVKEISQQAITQSITSPIQQPISKPIEAIKPSPTTSEKVVSADIINLANNTDLSIETIAREAHRIQEKQDLNEEVVISLR